MIVREGFELPETLKPCFRKAQKLEWITIAYLATVVVLMYLVMGTSQAMKTAWLEDVLSSFPAISFLVASYIYDKPATRIFPYGYHRVFSIAFLTGSVALFSMGCYLAVDAAISLLRADRPSIGSIVILGTPVWMGWLMILVLLYSALPPVLLGYKKLPLAKQLHNKILHTDADTQKADYMTAAAAIAGILGVGLGFWWADAVAALLISLSVLRDGCKNLANAIEDLMDRHPVHIGNDKPDELVDDIAARVNAWPWVREARVRFREHGQVYFGEILVVADDERAIAEKIEAGIRDLKDLHWKIHDITVMPVRKLPRR